VPESPDRVTLVTGTSSGIGDAVARELLRRGWRVVGASRRQGSIRDPLYSHLQVDLGDVAALIPSIEAGMAGLVADPALRRLALVNNAASPGLLGPITRADAARWLEVLAVNVSAPAALMGWLVRQARPGVALRIANVSTGAAVRAFPGLGAYGSSKAALRMAGMVLATELDADAASEALDATVLSYEPGLVDTAMQSAARGSPPEMLPSIAMFERFAAEGRLVPPTAPAAEIADYLEGDGHPRFSERRYGEAPRSAGRSS
jgi:benzil reductase ((S)-benzoin forming)